MSPEKGLLENDNSSSNHQFLGDMAYGTFQGGVISKHGNDHVKLTKMASQK